MVFPSLDSLDSVPCSLSVLPAFDTLASYSSKGQCVLLQGPPAALTDRPSQQPAAYSGQQAALDCNLHVG